MHLYLCLLFIDCIVVKDLSRLGRNYLETGDYLEKIFPFFGIRFIAVTDGYDSITSSASDDGLIVPMKNLINEAYAKDMSKKISTAINIKQRQGKFIGCRAAYGYMKSPEDKNQLIIDKEVSPIVARIFECKVAGMGNTPYGYDENDTLTRYNILYLMHGWGGIAGEYFDFTSTKNLFDNLIENGDIPPIIIVSATFYNENSSTDFGSSIREFHQFHQDFENHLMPAVEGQFHTYAQSVSDEDLKASRSHRAFGGFSLGSVTTWLKFCYDYDYIRYFLPMSGSCWYYGTYGDFQTKNNVDFIEQLVKDENLDERGYFIYHTTGTQDTVKSQTVMQAEEMIARAEVFTPDHYVFYQKDGGYHDFNAVQEYLYNALPLFFHDAE